MKNTTTHHNSISAFARLLATEDIRVRHSADASTASFDVRARVLTLPIWENMTTNLYDMLVGHEVAHALYTPNDVDEKRGCLSCCSDIDPDAPMNVLPVINIVEDARIERLIKSKYPGLRRDFTIGYRGLHDADIFDIDEHGGVAKMGFLDRINLHFKLGILGILNVPMAEGTEMWFVNRIENAVTWNDVVEISRDLYEYEMQKMEEQEQNSPSSTTSSASGDSSDDGSKSESSTSDAASERQEQGQDQQPSSNSSEDNADGSGSGSSTGDDGPKDQKPGHQIRSHTQEAIDENLRDRADYECGEKRAVDELSVTMPKPILDNMIIGYSTISEWWNNAKTKDSYGRLHDQSKRTLIDSINRQMFDECDEFMNAEKSTVSNLVKQFEMRKAADEHRRTSIQKSGRLDTLKMINYKWSEDIFAKNQVVSDGKNHGFVIVVDWSGSMCYNLESTVKQAITLAMFCRKAGIPFELYAFSDRTYALNPHRLSDTPDVCPDKPKFWEDLEQYPAVDDSHHNTWRRSMSDLMMINFLSSSCNQRQFLDACRMFYSVALTESYGRTASRKYNPQANNTPVGLDLGGTPLDEALTALHWILPKFRAKTNCQILNTVILTDGEGHQGAFQDNIIRNPITKMEYGSHPKERNDYYGRTTPKKSTFLLLKSLKETTDTNLIGMYLTTGQSPVKRGVSSHWINYYTLTEKEQSILAKSYKNNRYFVAPGVYADYFDEAYVIDARVEPEQDINLPDSATHAKLRSAFVKGMKSRGMSRNLMNRFIEVVAR